MPNQRKRASDEEREAAARRLGESFRDGRIREHELEERLDKALGATTHGELKSVTRDLPTPRRVAPPIERKPALKAKLARLALWYFPALVATVVWVLFTRDQGFWPLIFFVICAIPHAFWLLARTAFRRVRSR